MRIQNYDGILCISTYRKTNGRMKPSVRYLAPAHDVADSRRIVKPIAITKTP